MFRRIECEGDPVGGKWTVRVKPVLKVWTDASSIAMGVVLEESGNIIEDASWLRKKNDISHINMSELDAMMKGINMAVKWNPSCIELITDSATVFGWLKSVIEKSHNIQSKAMGELLIKRRLQILEEMMQITGIPITPILIPFHKNKADALTRVPQTGLRKSLTGLCLMTTDEQLNKKIEEIHRKGHFGIARTYEMAKCGLGNEATKEIVRKVIAKCDRCAKFDPHRRNVSFNWKIAAPRVWQRLATDVTHVNNQPYLTVVDSKSKFTVWQKLITESGVSIAASLEKVFAWAGPPNELLSDNGTAFRSTEVMKVLEKWSIKQLLSCAYRPQGNGIVERIHRTIKRTVARSQCEVTDAVFWYNVTKEDSKHSPYEILFRATARRPGVNEDRKWINEIPEEEVDTQESGRNKLKVGENVLLRPSDGRCDREWTGPHRVSKIIPPVGVEINNDGITRYANHLRKMYYSDEENKEEDEDENEDAEEYEDGDGEEYEEQDGEGEAVEEEPTEIRRTTRIRRPPERFQVVEW